MPDQDSSDENEGGDTWWMAGLKWLWKNKKAVAKKVKEVRSWWSGADRACDGPTKKILVLGSGGVGKSTLGRLLQSDYDFPIECPGEYEESHRVETYQIGGDTGEPQAEVYVPPGQAYKRDATWSELLSDVGAGAFRGIVVINAFGYHSLGEISFKEHKLYDGSKPGFLADYLEISRKDEIAVLEMLIPQVKLCRERLWLIGQVPQSPGQYWRLRVTRVPVSPGH